MYIQFNCTCLFIQFFRQYCGALNIACQRLILDGNHQTDLSFALPNNLCFQLILFVTRCQKKRQKTRQFYRNMTNKHISTLYLFISTESMFVVCQRLFPWIRLAIKFNGCILFHVNGELNSIYMYKVQDII